VGQRRLEGLVYRSQPFSKARKHNGGSGGELGLALALDHSKQFANLDHWRQFDEVLLHSLGPEKFKAWMGNHCTLTESLAFYNLEAEEYFGNF
jgi:hypothetical protein